MEYMKIVCHFHMEDETKRKHYERHDKVISIQKHRTKTDKKLGLSWTSQVSKIKYNQAVTWKFCMSHQYIHT